MTYQPMPGQEQLVYRTFRSMRSMVAFYVKVLPFLAVMIVVNASMGGYENLPFPSWILFVTVPLGICVDLFIVGFIRRRLTPYVLTTQRVTATRPLSRRVESLDLSDIAEVKVRQNGVDRAFGVGTIELHSRSRPGHKIPLVGVTKPDQLAAEIKSYIPNLVAAPATGLAA